MQVQYHLLPEEGKAFNLNQVEGALLRLPGCFRLPRTLERCYVIAASANMAKYLEAQLKLNPGVSLATQGLVTLSPEAISIHQDAPREVLAQLEPWVTWLMKRNACRVFSETGEDWTHHYGQNPHGLFVEEDAWS